MRDIWPSQQEIYDVVGSSIDSDMFRASYGKVFEGDVNWQKVDSTTGDIYEWESDSTYVRNPPYFEGMSGEAAPVADIKAARVLALLGDSVTTDHISPAGNIAADTPAAKYLESNGVTQADFNSYGSRRGNHEVMMRGTFANIRLRNRLAPGTEGGWTKHQPSGEQMSIYDASVRYREEGTPLIVLAGSEYGTGSSRDWAAKGTMLLGVTAVIAKSFERIHRSNLIGMGVLPLQFRDGEDAESLGLTGTETFDISGHVDPDADAVTVTATPDDGVPVSFQAKIRIDTPKERDYFEHGGILHYVLRQLAA
jgi:aconitate hydratase